MRNGGRSGSVEVMTVRCVGVDDNPVFVAAARNVQERDGVIMLSVAANGAEAFRCVGHLDGSDARTAMRVRSRATSKMA
jgi:hypothetical protein